MECESCGAPVRQLWARADAVGFERLVAAAWIELQRCPRCPALWASGRHEPHGAQRLWTLWPRDRDRFEALLGAPDGEQILGEWHDAVVRERWLDLPPAERAEVERWRERTRREHNPIDRRTPARFVDRSVDVSPYLEGPLAPGAASAVPPHRPLVPPRRAVPPGSDVRGLPEPARAVAFQEPPISTTNDILELTVRGNDAIATVRQEFTRLQVIEGTSPWLTVSSWNEAPPQARFERLAVEVEYPDLAAGRQAHVRGLQVAVLPGEAEMPRRDPWPSPFSRRSFARVTRRRASSS